MDNLAGPLQHLAQFPEPVQAWINIVLVWTGFGTLVGLLAKLIMPGRDPGGAVATWAMGIGGAVLGSGTWALLVKGERVTLISPIGLVVATAGAFCLLALYRLLGGYWFIEGEVPSVSRRHRNFLRRRRPRAMSYYDE